MTQLASRAVLSAMLGLAALVVVLAAASRPDTAAADPPRAERATSHSTVQQLAAEGRSRTVAPSRAVKRRVRGTPPLGRGLRAVQIANRLTGIPYSWGGASPGSGFDCSGLVQYVYAKLGISLPHYTVSQYGRGRAVSRSSLRPGDLVFFYELNHVGIYAGGGKYIHAPRSGTTVRWSSLAAHGGYFGARRIISA